MDNRQHAAADEKENPRSRATGDQPNPNPATDDEANESVSHLRSGASHERSRAFIGDAGAAVPTVAAAPSPNIVATRHSNPPNNPALDSPTAENPGQAQDTPAAEEATAQARERQALRESMRDRQSRQTRPRRP